MDWTNNKIGRYQATVEDNDDKSVREVFDELASRGGVITSLEQVKRVYGIQDTWIYTGKDGVRGEDSVLIKDGLKEDSLKIVAVDKKSVKLKRKKG